MYRKTDTQPGCLDILCFLIAVAGGLALLAWIIYAHVFHSLPW